MTITTAGKKRILIMPAGPFQAPMISTAQKMGLFVVALDRNPSAPGLKRADIAEVVDPIDIDAAIAVARTHSVCAVTTLASDPAVVPVAEIATALGLPGLTPSVAFRARNKLHARERLAQRLPEYCPDFMPVRTGDDARRAAEKLGMPFILKPVDGNGSKGVRLVENIDEVEEAYAYARGYTGADVLLAEQRLMGHEVSVEAITYKGTTSVIAITDKEVSEPPFCVEVGHTVPTSLPESAQIAIRGAVAKIIDAFELADTPTHIELFQTGAGPKVVEIGARLGGGRIASDLVPLATGVDMVKAAIQIALGEEPQLVPERNDAAVIRFLMPGPGRIVRVTGIEEARTIPGITEVAFDAKLGEFLPRAENSDQRVGYIIARGADQREAKRQAEAAISIISVDCED